MDEIKLGVVEAKFADIIWCHEPLVPGELFRLAAVELGWKRQTTATVLKRLCGKGLFRKEGKIITSVMGREEFYALQSRRFVEDTFEGSLPAFLAAFSSAKKLSKQEIEELKQVIENMRRQQDEVV